MLCYRDMTFCSAKCATLDCRRNFTAKESAKARVWWGGMDAPVAFADFKTGCPDYREPQS